MKSNRSKKSSNSFNELIKDSDIHDFPFGVFLCRVVHLGMRQAT
jgi:hypothetical protein